MAGVRERFYGTTIVCARRYNRVAMGGDGQITFGDCVMKGNAKKVRKLYHNHVIGGFAGAVADAVSLCERLEEKLEKFSGNLIMACSELAKEWRTDKVLRHLEAMILVADKKQTFLLSGRGEVFEPEDQVISIGSGGNVAKGAGLALLSSTRLGARKIVEQSLAITSQICIYTNDHYTVEELT